MQTQFRRRLMLAGVLAAGALAGQAFTQAPSTEPTLVDPKSKDYGSRPVAYINTTTAVTRADLAEFLIARGGHEKVELLVNKLIIEEAAKKRNITVTPQEMEAAFKADLNISNPPIRKEDFINLILPKYNKTYFEWMEDVVRPRLILGKMCADRVKVTDEDLLQLYTREYGEKKAVKIIIWPKGDDLKSITKTWDLIRKSEAEFDATARSQSNASLASTAGEIKPIARFQIGDDKDKIVETIAFTLKEGEVSQIFETHQGYMVMKLVKTIPADAKVKLADVKERLHKEAYDLKQAAEIPKMFAELSKDAKPSILLSGPPAAWRFEKPTRGAEDVIRENGGIQPTAGTAPMK